ncbi:sulfite exporter TauE/SafE family protein [Vitreoscilla stercoraria]|uniref:Probable membrane transporter protein n=1 Tax=Vitreoscilla stercoraria TaxID=61 RepID=A0ABY4ECW1_VITST|nr:sulfite exporter TauE/SafE family protein [Vitreoscilla stercoraria]UOO93126.1 sulfite exporter TauE/SafE family protein [Vitreoscilla stercoraria]
MTIELLAFLIAGAAAGGFISGLAGFGTALLSLSIWLYVMPTWQAVALVAATSVFSGLQSMWSIRSDLRQGTHALPWFLLPALFGIPLGAWSLQWVQADMLKLLIAVLMLAYGVFRLCASQWQFRQESPSAAHALIGFIGGLLGGAAALSGVIPTMWCALQTWPKSQVSAVLRPYNLVIIALAMALYAYQGFYSSDTLVLFAVALPITLVFSQIGLWLFHRLNDVQFRRLINALMFGCGGLLLVNQLF